MMGQCMFSPGLMVGNVWHKRHEGKSHQFSYPVFYLMLDVDLFGQQPLPWCLSRNRWNIFSVFEQDYGGGGRLKQHIKNTLSGAGLYNEPAGVRMLTMPRLLGYQFNPITIYYCLSETRDCYAVLYEVHNTFGERHTYVCDVSSDTKIQPHRADKVLHVSPFFDQQGEYLFDHKLAEDGLGFSIKYQRSEAKPALTATLSLTRQQLSASTLLRTLSRMPLGPLKVTLAIHYEALRLWSKRLRVFSKPEPPQSSFSFKQSDQIHEQ